MLPLKNRLKKKTDFGRVFKKGRAVKEDFLLLKFTKNNLAASRFGFVVGQKVSKKATLRNKIKRRLREATKRQLPQIKPGFDGAFVALRGLEGRSLKEVENAVEKILKKAGLKK